MMAILTFVFIVLDIRHAKYCRTTNTRLRSYCIAVIVHDRAIELPVFTRAVQSSSRRRMKRACEHSNTTASQIHALHIKQMDQDSWISHVFGRKRADSNERAAASASFVAQQQGQQQPTLSQQQQQQKQSLLPEVVSNRYLHDMAQAKVMRTRKQQHPRPGVGGGTAELSVEDLNLGLKGLDRAREYQRRGQLEKSLKLYELSLDLLIRYLRNISSSSSNDDDGTDRSVIEAKVHAALSDAEAAKVSLARQQQQRLQTTGQQQLSATGSPESQSSSSFRSLSNALVSALGTTANAKPKPPVSNTAVISTRNARQRPKATTRPVPSASRDGVVVVVGADSDELRQTVMSEFYVNLSDLQKTTWNDIAGLSACKQALQEAAILPLLRPDLFTGLRRPQNIMLWGPPGTGKTLLVRAVAHESGSSLFVCTSSALTSKWMGDSEKMVRKLFQVARELAPSILFLDEIDALLGSRKSDNEHEASRRLKTEFMVQMDGITKHDEGNSSSGRHLLLIACTNCPWDVDSAVMRRFPRRIFAPLPDSETRRALIEYLLQKTGKHSVTTRQIATLVKRTEGFTCSDITAIASEAAFGPLRSLGGIEAIKDCTAADVRPVQLKDFESVINGGATKSVTGAQLQRYDEWQRQQAAS